MKKNALGRSGSLLISSGACLILLLTLVEQACAQYQFDTWTTEQGLPQNSINDMLQTRDGYLWLATNGGLVRFDGVRFKVFDRSTEGVKTQRINALFEDSKGTLWCGAENAMLIRYYDGRFTTYTVEDGLPFDIVYEMEEDDEGNLWIRWRGEVTRFDGRHFNNYKPADFTHNIQVKLNKANELWWSQDTAGLHYLVKGHVRTYLFQNDLPKIEVTGVSRDQYGNLWIQTKGSGVIKVRNGRQELYTMREGLPDNSVELDFIQIKRRRRGRKANGASLEPPN